MKASAGEIGRPDVGAWIRAGVSSGGFLEQQRATVKLAGLKRSVRDDLDGVVAVKSSRFPERLSGIYHKRGAIREFEVDEVIRVASVEGVPVQNQSVIR